MASFSIPLHFDAIRNPLLQNNSYPFRKAPSILHHSFRTTSGNSTVITPAKFNFYEMMGGRGLCNGEEGLRKELEKSITRETESLTNTQDDVVETSLLSPYNPVGQLSFDKELMGLTGGFPGGERGLQSFIEKNPSGALVQDSKLKSPELPLLVPGMIVNVKNPENPFYLYSGIVQRVADGNAGVLFEGEDRDKLLTFKIHELERRETEPHMVDPTSVIHESFVDRKSE